MSPTQPWSAHPGMTMVQDQSCSPARSKMGNRPTETTFDRPGCLVCEMATMTTNGSRTAVPAETRQSFGRDKRAVRVHWRSPIRVASASPGTEFIRGVFRAPALRALM